MGGKLSTVTYYKNKIVTNYNGQSHTSYVYKYNDHKTSPKKQTNNWSFITSTKKINGYKWFKIYGWNQGAGAEVYGQYYRTSNLAKELANKHYPNFKYMDTKD